jgi:sugar lactone lactonase YvrE
MDSTGASRYQSAQAPVAVDGWAYERVTRPSRLYSANGLRTGRDGRIYVAQVSGSQISALDPDSGDIETVSPMGGGIVGPDDLTFDEVGNLYATEITEGRVSERAPNGTVRVIRDDLPVANPITYHAGRLIAGECRPGGRIMELDRHGGAPRLILDNVPMPNAFEVGPDDRLYFPVMGTNEIWRVSLSGGASEVVARDLAAPDSVKFDRQGFIVSTQAASGQVLRIDPSNGTREVLATIAPGLDNCTFVGDRLFVSSISGQINEVLANGTVRSVVPDGLQWPLGLAVNEDDVLFVADGGYTYTLPPAGSLQLAGMLFSPGFPGYTRGVAAAGTGDWLVTTANGEVSRFTPALATSKVLASGFEQLYGVATRAGGDVVFVDLVAGAVFCANEAGTTRLASGLKQPKGVAVDARGTCYVTESAAGRVVRLDGPKPVTVLDGLTRPEGLLIHRNLLTVVDAGAREVVEFDLDSGRRRTLAKNLPIGAPPGIVPLPLKAFPPLCGAMGPFADIARAHDGSLYLSGDAEGSVLALRPLPVVSRHTKPA